VMERTEAPTRFLLTPLLTLFNAVGLATEFHQRSTDRRLSALRV